MTTFVAVCCNKSTLRCIVLCRRRSGFRTSTKRGRR